MCACRGKNHKKFKRAKKLDIDEETAQIQEIDRDLAQGNSLNDDGAENRDFDIPQVVEPDDDTKLERAEAASHLDRWLV